MEPERGGASGDGEGFYPAVSPDLVRSGAAAFSQHQPAAEFAPVSLGHQEAFLRASHYTVVTSDGAVVHHVEKTEDGETSFCVQAVPAPFAAGADLDKEAVSHADAEPQPQYLVSDLATYQLSAAGDVYKLVVREEKEPHADDPELHPYSQVQLTADQLADASVTAPVAGSVIARTPTPPPAPLPPPLPPQHCLVCDLSLFNYRALGIFGHTTHQTSTTYAVKLRQVTGHRSNFVYHSEVICESCASLLNVVDSFESRLREIKARLEYTRAEVAEKFVRTCSRYDTLSLNRPVSAEAEGGMVSGEKADVEIHTRGAGKGKKRLAVSEEAAFEPPVKKKARTKTTPEKDVSYEKTKSIDSSNEEPGGRRRPVRRTVAERVPAVENDSEEEDAPADPDSFLQTEAAQRASPQPAKSDAEEDADDPGDETYTAEEADGDDDDEDDEDEEDEAEDEQPLQDVADSDSSPVRVANMCAECGRLFINPMVQRVHVLSHQRPTPPPLPPQPTAEDFVTIIDMDHYGTGADDVLAQAVQQMNRAESPPVPPPPPALPPPPPLQPKPAEGAGTAAAGEGARGLRKVQDVYKCDTCPNVFKTVQGLQRHHRKEHVQSVWRCFVCWQALDSLRRLKRHVAAHGEKNACAVCLEPFESKVALKAHVTRKHPETQTKNNFCELCQKHFDNQGFLEHARGVHGVGGDAARSFKCGQCGKMMVTSACYLRHLKIHKKDYKCQYCAKSFNGRTNLDNHERTHTGEKPYFCPDCERSFTSKQVRDIHVRTFHRQNPYACKRCNRRCESKASFIRHMRSHAGVTPYECPVCCKKMTTEYSLKMHIRAVHDRKMPFKCDICQKAFPYKSSLTLHANTHSGGKSHVCDVCGKCFASRGSLRTHMHTHSAEKPYKCEWCDRSFSRKDLLAGHKLQIHGIQPEMNYSRLSKH